MRELQAAHTTTNAAHPHTSPLLFQGLASATPPFELMSGGVRFWDHLAAHPDEAATFDAAMHAMTHLGGAAAVSSYAWGRYSRVVDVGGGVGGFLAAILTRHGGLRGLLLDQAGQVARAQKVSQGAASVAARHQGIAAAWLC